MTDEKPDIIMTEGVADYIRETKNCPVCESEMKLEVDTEKTIGYRCTCGRIYLLEKQ